MTDTRNSSRASTVGTPAEAGGRSASVRLSQARELTENFVLPLADCSIRIGSSAGSADRWSVQDPAIGPKLIKAERNAELGPDADVALEHFGVVPDTPNDADHPVSAKARSFTKVPLGPHEPHDLWLFRVHGLLDGCG